MRLMLRFPGYFSLIKMIFLKNLFKFWNQVHIDFNKGITAPSTYIQQTNDIQIRKVFANRHFKKQEMVECCPLILIERTYDELPIELRGLVFDWRALTNIAYPCHAIALGLGNIYQHCEQANLRFEANLDNTCILFIANSPIKKGEELTINFKQAGGKPCLLEN